MKLKIGNYFIKAEINKIIPNVIGVGSITEDGYHALFFDLDNTTLTKIKKTLTMLQKEYELGDFYVFKTSKNSYHAICLNKMTMGMIIDIHQKIQKYDTKHDIHSIKRGYWVLRQSDKEKNKIKYLLTLENKPEKKLWDKSNAHRLFLNKFYKLEIPQTKEYDKYEYLYFDSYSTIRKRI